MRSVCNICIFQNMHSRVRDTRGQGSGVQQPAASGQVARRRRSRPCQDDKTHPLSVRKNSDGRAIFINMPFEVVGALV